MWVLHTSGRCGHYLCTGSLPCGEGSAGFGVHPRAPAVPALMASHEEAPNQTWPLENSQWVFTSWFAVAHFQQPFFLLRIFTVIKRQTKHISKGKQLGWWMCPAKEGCRHIPQAARRNEPFLLLRDTNPMARFHPARSLSDKSQQ